MFLIAVLLGICFAEGDEDLSKKVGQCWLMTIQDINSEQQHMTNIIESIPDYNKTEIYYKVQMSMIITCMELIDINNENHMSQSTKYKDVVKAFQYDQFLKIEPIMTKDEESLYKLIKNLEKDLGQMQKKLILEKRTKHGQKIEEDWYQAWAQKEVPQTIEQPGAGQYVFFAIIMIILFGGGYFVLRLIQQMDQKNKQK